MRSKVVYFVDTNLFMSIIIKYLFAVCAALALVLLVNTVSAEVTPPTFLSCTFGREAGDIAHYETGVHQIVGGGLLEGSDDVYSAESGNALQCFCPVEGASGIQTVWWKIGDLSQEEIDGFLNQGWILDNGKEWNLENTNYLAKNSEFSCAEPSPTPTPTPTSTPTPTPTATPTPTPTPGDEPDSSCSTLSASPADGTAPLTVRFNGSGFDEDGKIKKYRFDFGDASGGQPQAWEQEGSEAYHRYEFAGTYRAKLTVQDSRNNWRDSEDNCTIEIKVDGKPKVLAATITSLPKTGLPLSFVFGLTSLSGIGAYIYKRFRLV